MNERSGPQRGVELHIAWYVRLRWAAIAGAVLLGAAAAVARLPIPLPPYLGVLAAAAAYNASFALCQRTHLRCMPCPLRGHPTWCLTGQVAADWVVLLLLLHISGGVENPFVMLMAYLAAMSGALLPLRSAVGLSACGVLAFFAMTYAEAASLIGHVHLGMGPPGLYESRPYVIAVAGGGLAAASLVSALTSTITDRLRRRGEVSRKTAEQLQAATEDLSSALGDLQKLDEEKSRFLYVAAHELGSPLATIESLLATVSDGYAGQVDEGAAVMVRRARGKVADLLRLVSDLMTLSRVKEGLEPTKRVLIDVKSALTRILEDEKVNADEKAITLSAELPRHIPPLYCTHENVDSLFRNLIRNAVRYTPEGGSVSLTVRIDGAAIHAEISDTGIGIPAEDLEKVFTEFYRSPTAKRHAKGGTGLGLSIVKRVVDTLGGDIHVESEVGAGTTFRVQLPGYGSGD